jgi:urease accessory protein
MVGSMNFMPLRQLERPPAQRAIGRLALVFGHDPILSRTRVQKFYQQGCLKARLPRPSSPQICETITLNIGGGIAGGDSLATGITLARNAQAVISSQAAERIYRALDFSPATLKTTITLGPNASLDYLPQETILFDGFALNRSLEINLAETATYLGVESLIFGRQAMGETLHYGRLRDRITLRRAGTIILQDATRLEGDITAKLARKAVANGAIAMATLIYTGPDLPSHLQTIRTALASHPCESGASAFEGIIFTRILAPSAAALRACVIAVLKTCRDNRPLPRTWQS